MALANENKPKSAATNKFQSYARNAHFYHRHELSTTFKKLWTNQCKNLANGKLSSLKRSFFLFFVDNVLLALRRVKIPPQQMIAIGYLSFFKKNEIKTISKYNIFHPDKIRFLPCFACCLYCRSEHLIFCTTIAQEQQQHQKGRECDGKSAHKLCKNPLKVWYYRFFLYGIA